MTERLPARPPERLPTGPVIVVHLELRPGSGLAACCGLPLERVSQTAWPTVPRALCMGCYNETKR